MTATFTTLRFEAGTSPEISGQINRTQATRDNGNKNRHKQLERCTLHKLSSLLSPRSVAILGASSRPEALGNTVIKNLIAKNYAGNIYPVHPTADEVLGLQCYASLEALPEAVDCVVIALSYDKALPALEQMNALGTKSAVLFASGFAETGAEGKALQDRIAAFCLANDINLCGPNCLGLYSAHEGAALYSAALSESLIPGDLALISQSGSACIALSSLQRFDFSYLISLGNGAVTDISDYLDFVAQDEATRVAALFVETLHDPDRFAAAAAKMRKAGKPIIALKVGRSTSGAAASAAHTGAIASSDTALQAFFRRNGVILVEDYDELAETCALFLGCRRSPEGSGLGVLNVSGGELAMTCDIAERFGLELPALEDTTVATLQATLPAFASPRNPLDATGVAVFDTNMYKACLRALAADPGIALVAVSQDCPSTLGTDQAATYEKLAIAVKEVAEDISKPVVFFNNLSTPVHPDILRPLRAAGVPVLSGMRNSLKALSYLFSQASQLEGSDSEADHSLLRQDAWVSRLADTRPLTERESKAFLAAHGITVTREFLATSADQAVGHADKIGYPVVLKVESKDLPHKKEVDGVMLRLANAEEVSAGFDRLLERVRRKAPNAEIEGVLVQEMVDGGLEAILGVVSHPPFGPGIVVGAGGMLVEILEDSAFELAPVDPDLATEMIAQTRFSKLLAGFRGAPAGDRQALANALTRLSQIAQAYRHELTAVDLNPVAVRSIGHGAIVLDALVIQKSVQIQEPQ
ncbi:acetate--CoA ligase family protein [Mesorhizobium sp. SB112]|uniref:acetate--CoA ligase family protein n=1 Tax=Mesorhizobium sp. SB112 TaxID=3151853 RepID=UPI0032642FBD